MGKNERAQNAVIGWASDPGHSWLLVNLDEEDGYPRASAFASDFSFIDFAGANFAGIVYLEEDADAPRFIRHHNLDGRAWKTYELPEDNTVRDLPRGGVPQEKLEAMDFLNDRVIVIES